MFSWPPLDFSRDRKSIHTSSIGAEDVMLTSSADFVGAVFLLTHLSHRRTLCLMSSIIPGQKKRLRINDVVGHDLGGLSRHGMP